MPYLSIDDFRNGMDRRRKRVAGTPGGLWTLKDGHITRGGDVERRKKLVPAYDPPAGSFSLAAIRSQLYTFGSADLSGDTPVGIQFQRLQAPDTPAMVRILDAKPFQGKMYAIAEYDDGSIYHFYDGTRVSDWDAAIDGFVTPESVALRLAAKLAECDAVVAEVSGANLLLTAAVPGTAFTISVTPTDGGSDTSEDIQRTQLTANTAAVAETRATGGVEITGGVSDPGTDTVQAIIVNGVPILDAVIDWSGSNAATAIRVATSINNGTAIHGYSASVVDAVITIRAAPGTGTTPNGYTIAVETSGTVTVDADSTMSGGVAAVTAVAQVEKVVVSGTIEPEDSFTVTIDSVGYIVTGMSSAMGTSVYVDKQRAWSTAGPLWRYCSLADATIWDPDNATPGADAGFINVAQETEGTDDLVVATRYQGQAAIFSQSFINLWALDTDPANFAVADSLDNTGTFSPRAVVRYGNNDVFYLDSTGIRSLRARDASNAPFISDVGNAIDTFVQETLDALTRAQVRSAVAAIEPRDGRLWVCAGNRIIVLSFFPGAKISAWSYYEPAEFGDDLVEAVVRAGQRMYVRAGDTVYLYGGINNDEYPAADEAPCVVEIPFLSAGKPATFKEFTGFDIACDNDWSVEILYDPNNEERTINIGTVTKTTFNEMGLNASGVSTVMALKLTCAAAGAASISSLQIEYAEHKG